MENRFHTQNSTAMLLLVLCYIFLCSEGCNETDRQALLSFNHSWSLVELEEDCCMWSGISCDDGTGNVIGFYYSYSGLTGKFPDFLRNMTSLKSIYLEGNHFEGPLPTFLANMTSLQFLKLQTLDLSHNSFEGPLPTFLANMTSLQSLNLADNNFNGTIPESLSQLSKLDTLDLSHNSFEGPLPTFLANMTSLQFLNLADNNFNGTIPESLGQLSKLQTLDLSHNSFEGVMSAVHFAKLSQLLTLNLSSNSLSLELGSEWVPPFQLEYIGLASCQVGPRFPMWLRTQTRYDFLDMSNAGIKDSLPGWFLSMNRLVEAEIHLSFNHLHGEVPAILDNIRALYLNDNNLEGPFPHFSSTLAMLELDLDHNFFSGPIPLNIHVMLPFLKSLFLANNSFSGRIPHSICKIDSLVYLDLASNHFVGDVPECGGGELQSLMLLDLSSNNLSGIIPPSMGYLLLLRSLHLSRNKLQGKIPTSLKNCTNLLILDLADNKLFGNNTLTWIGSNMPSLKILSLRRNRFSGVIPSQLCLLSNLQLLDLAENEISGTIPHCFGNFSRMILDPTLENWIDDNSLGKTVNPDESIVINKGIEIEYTTIISLVISLDLSSNKLVGEIPAEIMSLAALKSLNLSKNQLGGSIPDKIGKLVSLESLDLSENLFTGKIPQSMSELTFLAHLNLSYNRLSGRIPSGNQLQTLEPSSYVGNRDLCGDPLENTCAGDKPPQSPPTRIDGLLEDEEDESEMKWFYIGLASGHTVGFWGVCGALFFKRNWRIAFFQFVTSINDWLLVTITVNVNRVKRKLKKGQV